VTDAALWSAWQLWMGIAVLVILVAAALLVTIWLTARRILADAVRALNAADAIRRQTLAIWQLEATNDAAAGIRETVERIDTAGRKVAETLERDTAAARRS
jgi:hypothetical protein